MASNRGEVLLQAALALPASDRLRLARVLLDSLDDDSGAVKLIHLGGLKLIRPYVSIAT